MNDTDILTEALVFHGHKCWASTAGVRLGLAAMRELSVDRAGAKQLHAIIVCPSCGELVAEPYARVAEGKIVCAACSGYPR